MKIILLGLLIFSAISASAQISERDRGIELYKKGDSNLEAVRILETVSKNKETKNDGQTWNYLGLAYIRVKNFSQARKALEQAAKLIPQDAETHLNLAVIYLLTGAPDKALSESEISIQINPQSQDALYAHARANLQKQRFTEATEDAQKIIALNPQNIPAYDLKADALINYFIKSLQTGKEKPQNNDLLVKAQQTLQICKKICADSQNLTLIDERLEILSAFFDYFENAGQNISSQTNLMTPPVPDAKNKEVFITSKPRAKFTDEARQSQTQGTISIAVLFGADGEIKYLFLVKGLGHGLDEQVVNAAKAITFQPAVKDGKPISKLKIMQYSFTIY